VPFLSSLITPLDVYTDKINAAMEDWGGTYPCSMSWMPNKPRLPCPAAKRAEMRSGQRKAASRQQNQFCRSTRNLQQLASV